MSYVTILFTASYYITLLKHSWAREIEAFSAYCQYNPLKHNTTLVT